MLPVDRIEVFCFSASYATTLALELLYLLRPWTVVRYLILFFATAGLLAHTFFISFQPLLLASPFGSLVLLAWVLAVIYLYGTLHYRMVSWGLFFLPLVLGLIFLAQTSPRDDGRQDINVLSQTFAWDGQRFWGLVHGGMLLLAAVGVCVGFIASLMYLAQSQRLRAKIHPSKGVKLHSLERLERMNRWAVTLAFPLLTLSLVLGVILGLRSLTAAESWGNAKLLSLLGLWVVFAILLYLRYGAHARGRQVAVWTIVAFCLLVLSLASPVHSFGG